MSEDRRYLVSTLEATVSEIEKNLPLTGLKAGVLTGLYSLLGSLNDGTERALIEFSQKHSVVMIAKHISDIESN